MENATAGIIAAEWDGRQAHVKAEADAQAIQRMGFGAKRGEAVLLHPLEAAYLLEKGKISISKGKKKITQKEILKPKAKPKLSEQYALFKAFRMDGRVVRFSPSAPLHWRVYARGVGREQDRPSTLVIIVGKGWKCSLQSLEPMLQTARLMRLDVGVGYVKDGRPGIIKLGKMPLEA